MKRKTRTCIRTNKSKTDNYEQKSTYNTRNRLTISLIQSNLHLFASTSPLHHPTTKKYSPPPLLRPSSLYPIVEFVHVQLCILCRNNYFCIQTHRCHGTHCLHVHLRVHLSLPHCRGESNKCTTYIFAHHDFSAPHTTNKNLHTQYV